MQKHRALNLTPHPFSLYEEREENSFFLISSISSHGTCKLTSKTQPQEKTLSVRTQSGIKKIKVSTKQFFDRCEVVPKEGISLETKCVLVSMLTGDFLAQNPDVHPEWEVVLGPDTGESGAVRRNEKGELTRKEGSVWGTTGFIIYRSPSDFGEEDLEKIFF